MVFEKLFSKLNECCKKERGNAMNMFCYQCEQAANGTGCTFKGICGKNADSADLQDLIIDGLKEIGFYAVKLSQLKEGEDCSIFRKKTSTNRR